MPTAAELELLLKFRDEATKALRAALGGASRDARQAMQGISRSLRETGSDLRQFSRNALQLGALLIGPFALAFREAARRMPEVRDQLAIIQEQFLRLQLALAQAALPALQALAAVIKRVADVFLAIPEPTRRAIAQFVLLAGALTLLAGALTRLLALLSLMGAILTGVGAKALAARHPILAAAAAALAAVAAFQGWKRAMDELNRAIEEMQGKMGALSAASVTFKSSMEEFWVGFSNTGLRAAQLVQGAIQGVEDQFTSLFTNLITGSVSGKEAFRQFALGVLQMVAQMIARFIATAIVLAALNAIPGFAAVAKAADAAALASTAASARRLQVRVGNPSFGGSGQSGGSSGGGGGGGGGSAFHSGGEVQARLLPGEFVVNREATARHRRELEGINSGLGSGLGEGRGVQNVFIINATDAASFRGKLSEHADLIEAMFQRAMRRNSGPMRESVRL